MDIYIGILVAFTVIVSPAASRSYADTIPQSILGNIRPPFQLVKLKYWQNPQLGNWDSLENWHPSVLNFYRPHHYDLQARETRSNYYSHRHQHHQSRGSYTPMDYWQGRADHNFVGRTDWAHQAPDPNAYNKFDAWQPWLNTPTRTTVESYPTAPSRQEIQICMRNCPTTPEYNPVCGSNNITYNNPGKLECARFCGIDVRIKGHATCNSLLAPKPVTWAPITPSNKHTTPILPIRPTTTTTTTSTPPPITPPRYPRPTTPETTTQMLIPSDVLSSIFTKPSDSEDNGDSDGNIETDIDIRSRAGVIETPSRFIPVKIKNHPQPFKKAEENSFRNFVLL